MSGLNGDSGEVVKVGDQRQRRLGQAAAKFSAPAGPRAASLQVHCIVHCIAPSPFALSRRLGPVQVAATAAANAPRCRFTLGSSRLCLFLRALLFSGHLELPLRYPPLDALYLAGTKKLRNTELFVNNPIPQGHLSNSNAALLTCPSRGCATNSSSVSFRLQFLLH